MEAAAWKNPRVSQGFGFESPLSSSQSLESTPPQMLCCLEEPTGEGGLCGGFVLYVP